MSEDELKMLIEQTLSGAIATIPGHLQEIEQNKDTLKVDNPIFKFSRIIIGQCDFL